MITGEKECFAKLPEQLRFWYYFGNIVQFTYEKIYDNEVCEDVYQGEMILTDDMNEYKIQLILKGIYGELYIHVGQSVSGFDICDMNSNGYESCCRYHITDFEQDRNLSIFCESIECIMME